MSDVGNWLSEFRELNPGSKENESSTGKKKENALPLNLELTAMDTRDKDFYANLTDEQKKEISLWLLMRYMSSSKGDSLHHLTMVNDIVNVNFNILSKHPELQWKLLALCGTNKKQYHEWIPPGKRAKKNKIEEALLSLNPLLSDSDLELLQKINSKEELETYFLNNALDDKTIKEIFKGTTGK